MRLNLVAEPSDCTQLPGSVQCAVPTYCILEPGSNRVPVGLKNISAKAITIPSQTVVGKLQVRMVPDDKASKCKQGPTGGKGAPGF